MNNLESLSNSLQIFLYRMDLKTLNIESSYGNLGNILGFDPVGEGWCMKHKNFYLCNNSLVLNPKHQHTKMKI